MLMCKPTVSSTTSTLTPPSSQRCRREGRDKVERMLHEIAYVLHLTRRVKDNMAKTRP
jgi:hypothetical protein